MNTDAHSIDQSLKQAVSTKIVPQAKVAFVGYMLLFVVMAVQIFTQSNVGGAQILYLLAYLVTAFIVVYGINCTVLGKCNMYAWIIAYILIITGLIGLIGMIMALSSRKN